MKRRIDYKFFERLKWAVRAKLDAFKIIRGLRPRYGGCFEASPMKIL
jgi:hypothetical protein